MAGKCKPWAFLAWCVPWEMGMGLPGPGWHVFSYRIHPILIASVGRLRMLCFP